MFAKPLLSNCSLCSCFFRVHCLAMGLHATVCIIGVVKALHFEIFSTYLMKYRENSFSPCGATPAVRFVLQQSIYTCNKWTWGSMRYIESRKMHLRMYTLSILFFFFVAACQKNKLSDGRDHLRWILKDWKPVFASMVSPELLFIFYSSSHKRLSLSTVLSSKTLI
jgi:hypothetical protein